MHRLLAAICVFSAMSTVGGISGAQAQAIQRYGSGGVGTAGTTPYGGTANSSGRSFTASGSNTTTPSASPSSDYTRVMNSVDSTTDTTLGQPGTDDQGDGSQTTATPSQDAPPPPVASGSVPNSNGAYNQGLGANGSGNSNGSLTSPTGMTGLGAYNKGPYASGQVTAPIGTSNSGPTTPTYTGQ